VVDLTIFGVANFVFRVIEIFFKLELHLILYESEIGERRASWQVTFWEFISIF
jgi:hypothetical protein